MFYLLAIGVVDYLKKVFLIRDIVLRIVKLMRKKSRTVITSGIIISDYNQKL